MNKQKAITIWDNHINGNISDFKTEVKKLNKRSLIDLIYFVLDEYENIKYTPQEVLSILMMVKDYLTQEEYEGEE